MKIKAKLLATAAAAFALGLAGAASAGQYITQLEWDPNGLHVPSYGTVTVTDHAADVDHATAYVNVLVQFDSAFVDKIVDTGEGHVAFAFNLSDTPNSGVEFVQPSGGGSFSYLGEWSFSGKGKDPGGFAMEPFGHFNNALQCCGKGASNGELPPLEFNVTNPNGIAFLGLNGNFFTSNSDGSVPGSPVGGWWFAVDTFDSSRPDGGNTFAVAGRDFCTVGVDCGGPGVPEPSTWGLMIAGFGSAGAMLRRRRTPVRTTA